MAIVQTPLLSEGATGSIGKMLTFSTWHGRKTVRIYSKPTDPKTPAQLHQRQFYTAMKHWWRATYPNRNYVEAWALYANTFPRWAQPWNQTIRYASPCWALSVNHPWVELFYQVGVYHKLYVTMFALQTRFTDPDTAQQLVYHTQLPDGTWRQDWAQLLTNQTAANTYVMTPGQTYTAYLTERGRRISGDYRCLAI